MFQVPTSRAHQSVLHFNPTALSPLWSKSSLKTMLGQEGEAGGHSNQVCQLPGRSSSIEPVLSQTQRDCPPQTRPSQAESPSMKGLSCRPQYPTSTANQAQTGLHSSYQTNTRGDKAQNTQTTKEYSHGTGDTNRKESGENKTYREKRREREKKEKEKKVRAQKEIAPEKKDPPKNLLHINFSFHSISSQHA